MDNVNEEGRRERPEWCSGERPEPGRCAKFCDGIDSHARCLGYTVQVLAGYIIFYLREIYSFLCSINYVSLDIYNGS